MNTETFKSTTLIPIDFGVTVVLTISTLKLILQKSLPGKEAVKRGTH